MEIEKTILRNLQYQDSYTRKVIPYLKPEYFTQPEDKLFFGLVRDHFTKYNTLPSKEEIGLAILDVRGQPEQSVKSAYEMAEEFAKEKDSPINLEWLIDQSEEFCQNRALYNAVMEVVDIIQKTGEDAKLMKTGTPDILNKALAVSFDSELGHNYLKDFDKRFDFYTRQLSTIPLHLKSFNELLDGGVERKTLNLVVAQSGGGKSIWLCDIAAHYMMNGYNVLYFTLEMEEEKIGKRIDANLMDVNIKDFKKMPKLQYDNLAKKVQQRNKKGDLRIKVFPSSTTTTGQLRYLIKELEQKENFKPDVIIVDYIGIMVPTRKRRDGNLYDDGKQISVELRDLAKENNSVLWSACQFNSQGMNNTDADMQHVADSRAIIHNADFAFGIISTEELIKNGQVMVKVLKAREGDKDNMGRFMIGLDKTKMRFYELQNNGLQVTAPQNRSSVATQKSVVTNNKQTIQKPPTQGVTF